MKCDRCSSSMEEGESREYLGQLLCEDCYLDVLSPAKTCDPWAVLLAKGDTSRSGVQLTPRQQKIYDLVKERQEIAFPEAARLLGMTEEQVRREFATLRHMELLRAHRPSQEILITLF